MTLRDWMKNKVTVCAAVALVLATGLPLKHVLGDVTISIIDPMATTIKIYTPNAVLPTTLLVPVEVYVDSGGSWSLTAGQGVTFQPRTSGDVESVEISVTGGLADDATDEGSGLWVGLVDLVDATGAVSPSFEATLNAIGTIPAYYEDPASTVTATPVTLTVSILDASDVDSNDDGDPIPDDDQIINLLPDDNDESVRLQDVGSGSSVIVTVLEDLDGNGANVGTVVGLSGGRTADVNVEGPAFLAADYVSAGVITNAVVMVTFANDVAELLSSGTAPADLEVVQGLIVRVVVLVSTDNGITWDAYEGDLPAGFSIDIEILDAVTPVTAANVYGFGLTRQSDGTFAPETDAANVEIDPASSATRATVTDGIINAALSNANSMISVATTGGAGASSGGGSGSSSSTCFIATAAYGTPMAAEIDTLRAVRDMYLLNNVAGSAFVDTYYRLSPAVADKVAESPMLAALVRALLTPFVLLGKLILAAPMALMGLVLAGAGLLVAHRRTRSHQS
ncbi:MAG TPA: hypothetical protein EYN96_09805 [Candidatus Hydrogenedentes bacterium]|nr:hypothetical protein [Candidatus Hydrogenedentota bacterium]